jgi:hypothetical protein
MTRQADCDCDNCRGGDLPSNPFIAPRVTHGMLLGEDDFRVLVGYPRGKHLLHQAWLHGTGVIWGYPVCRTGLWDLEVGTGLAVDPMGRDLIHEACERLDLRTVRDQAIADGDLQETTSKDADCRTASVWACVVAEFDGCLSSPVPTLADPCDVTRSYDDYSRVLERARIRIRPGRCPDRDGCPDPRTSGRYHRVRVLLGLDALGTDDEAGQEAQQARERVLAAAYPARALECELAELACRDAIDLQPEAEPGEHHLGLYPTADEDPAVVLAEVLIRLRDRDGCWEFDGPGEVRECVRTTLLPTDLITELTCGLAPGLLDPAPTTSVEAPRVVGRDIELSSDGRKMIIPVTAALVSGTVPGSVEVTTLTTEKGDRWVVEDIYDAAYDRNWGDGPGGAIVVRLAYSLAERPPGALVRVRVRGSGGKPVMGADPLAPLAGLVGGPAGSEHDGHDAIWTFRVPPRGEQDSEYAGSNEDEAEAYAAGDEEVAR